ncbi:MAG: FecR domain-containing protein [Cyclobacteriaceae bacterium]
MRHYEQYQVNDFVTDPFFRKWVLTSDEEANAHWQGWLLRHPEKSELIAQARRLVSLTDIPPVKARAADFYHTRNKIKARLFQQQAAEQELQSVRNQHTYWKLMAATVSAFLIASIYFMHLWPSDQEQYNTGYGEIRHVMLPDGSKVTLNANSHLAVPVHWEENREVWLVGEAFFDVKKVAEPDARKLRKFTVHAGNVDIDVLGTRFNVDEKCKTTQIVLEEGLVSLRRDKATDSRFEMHEGEAVTYSKRDEVFKKEVVNTQIRLAWRRGMHVFDGTPLYRIAEMLENNYGFQVKLQPTALRNRRFSAQVPYGEIDLLINLLQESLNIKVVTQGKALLINSIDGSVP